MIFEALADDTHVNVVASHGFDADDEQLKLSQHGIGHLPLQFASIESAHVPSFAKHLDL